jgi:hypothetical protein
MSGALVRIQRVERVRGDLVAVDRAWTCQRLVDSISERSWLERYIPRIPDSCNAVPPQSSTQTEKGYRELPRR